MVVLQVSDLCWVVCFYVFVLLTWLALIIDHIMYVPMQVSPWQPDQWSVRISLPLSATSENSVSYVVTGVSVLCPDPALCEGKGSGEYWHFSWFCRWCRVFRYLKQTCILIGQGRSIDKSRGNKPTLWFWCQGLIQRGVLGVLKQGLIQRGCLGCLSTIPPSANTTLLIPVSMYTWLDS